MVGRTGWRIRESTFLAQRLEHWISNQAILVCITSETWDFSQTMHHLLATNFHIRKSVKIGFQ